MAAFARAAMPGGRLSADLAVATAILMWIRFCWYLKNMRLGWAKFVLMIEQIAWDLREYLLFFLVVLLMFASAFYPYIGPRKSAEFGFHDDGAPNAYRNFGYKADDPNRLNYTINAVEAIVDNRTKKLEAELAATREKIDKLTDMIQALLEKDQ